MSARTITVVGGPHDGLTFARSRPAPAFGWVDARGRMYRDPRAGTFLYRTADDATLVFAGHTYGRCRSCGCWHGQPASGERLLRCTLCGGVLEIG